MSKFKAAIFLLSVATLLSCNSVTNDAGVKPSYESERYIEFIGVVSSTLSEAIPETRESIQMANKELPVSAEVIENLSKLDTLLSELHIANDNFLNKNYTSESMALFKSTPAALSVIRKLMIKQLAELDREQWSLSMTLKDISKLIVFIESSVSEVNQTFSRVVWVQENA